MPWSLIATTTATVIGCLAILWSVRRGRQYLADPHIKQILSVERRPLPPGPVLKLKTPPAGTLKARRTVTARGR